MTFVTNLEVSTFSTHEIYLTLLFNWVGLSFMRFKTMKFNADANFSLPKNVASQKHTCCMVLVCFVTLACFLLTSISPFLPHYPNPTYSAPLHWLFYCTAWYRKLHDVLSTIVSRLLLFDSQLGRVYQLTKDKRDQRRPSHQEDCGGKEQQSSWFTAKREARGSLEECCMLGYHQAGSSAPCQETIQDKGMC